MATLQEQQRKNIERLCWLVGELFEQVDGRTVKLRLRKNVDAEMVESLGDTAHKVADGMQIDLRKLRADWRGYLERDSHILDYGLDAKRRTFVGFRYLPGTNEQGAIEPIGRVELQRNGTCTTRPVVIGTKEMFALEPPRGEDRRLPSAVLFLVLQKCQYLGYSAATDTYWFKRLQPDGRGNMRPVLCRLIINERNPDVVVSGTASASDNFEAHPEVEDFVSGLAKDGKLRWSGPLPEPVEKVQTLEAKTAPPMATAGINA